MAATQLQFFDCGTGAAHRRIAYLQDSVAEDGTSGRPGLIWLCGFKSEMTSTKASALAEFARERGYGCLRFDYSGHGQSGGRFEDGTLSRWLEEARAAFARTLGPQILVGSSMGGYLALLLLRALLTDAPAEAQR
ncbi:MAG: alpha/beta fold hydrolase, partial [Hyphomicrobiaceae bacterium]